MAIGTPTRLTYNTEIRQKRVARDHAYRARSRPAAGSRTSSATTIDLATWTYHKVLCIIRTGAAKMAQNTMHAHGVDTRGWKYQRPSEGCRPPEHALCMHIHPVISGGPGAGCRECHCSLRSGPLQPFRAGSPPLHACARKGAKGSVGCRDMRMLRMSYYCIACGSRKITEAT